jgi:hypothetical protein
MALDASSVYALYAPTPTVGVADSMQTRLARIDRHSGSVRTTRLFPGAADLVLSGGWLWIGGGYSADAAATDTAWLYQVDPGTLKVEQTIHLPQPLDARAYSAARFAGTVNLLWMGYGRQLFQLDPLNGTTIRTLSFPGTATSVSLDPSGRLLYVGLDVAGVSEDTVMQLNALTGLRLASVSTGGAGLGGPDLAAADDGVWIAYATGMQGAIEHLRAVGLGPLPISGGGHRYTNGIRVAVGGGVLWLVDGWRLDCADLVSGAIRASSGIQFGMSIVADSMGSYLGAFDGVDVLRPDRSCHG